MKAFAFASRLAVGPACLLLVSGCGTLIAAYSERAYSNATTLKAEALAQMGKATESFKTHQANVEALSVRIDAAYEYAKGTGHNQISTAQWALLKDPQQPLYGGFVRRWKARDTVPARYVEQKQKQVAEAFDYIICLEVNKQARKACEHARPATPAAAEADQEG